MSDVSDRTNYKRRHYDVFVLLMYCSRDDNAFNTLRREQRVPGAVNEFPEWLQWRISEFEFPQTGREGVRVYLYVYRKYMRTRTASGQNGRRVPRKFISARVATSSTVVRLSGCHARHGAAAG